MKTALAKVIFLFVCLAHTTGLCIVSHSPPILETRNWKLETDWEGWTAGWEINFNALSFGLTDSFGWTASYMHQGTEYEVSRFLADFGTMSLYLAAGAGAAGADIVGGKLVVESAGSLGTGLATAGGAGGATAVQRVAQSPAVQNMMTFYHQGNLANGVVDPLRTLSTSISPNIQHYNPGEALQTFNVPINVFQQWMGNGWATPIMDTLYNTTIRVDGWLFQGPASGLMNNYIVQ